MRPTGNRNFTSASRAQATADARAALDLGCAAIRAWPQGGLWNGFLGRRGGVSRGPYQSLNLSHFCGDDPADVDANWRRLQSCFPGTPFVLVNQVHGNAIHVVSDRDAAMADSNARPAADGIVTAARGVILGILTADCVPVLLVDRAAGVVGALHAGWRGVIAGIAHKGVRAMTSLGARPDRIEAAMGPAIGRCCFEVDIELARRFEREMGGARAHIRIASPHKAFIDLRGLLHDQLIDAEVESRAINPAAICTRCSSDGFFSRRAAGGAVTGLQLSFIGLPE